MFTAEVVDVVGAYRDSGQPPAVFAAAVPRNYERVVGELLNEVYEDDAAIVRIRLGGDRWRGGGVRVWGSPDGE